ncbi:MAG: hypothetical protein M3R29_07225 [Verrucomicrobiota bacterium]|nr:hypothetical protein [Verrucomicrobiota bacterium]
MASIDTTVLQIVPQLPGSYDGVGDYALKLAKALSADHGLTTVFAVAKETEVSSKEGFQVISGLNSALFASEEKYHHVILHYVNYGYQMRGAPIRLRNFARQLRRNLRGRWITMFHELYASGPPWKSAFWLRPLQVKIARDMIDISDTCFVSGDVIENEIHAYDLRKPVHIQPVMSNFGEPQLANFGERALTRWAICGGTALILRSLRSFAVSQRTILKMYRPEQLDIVGGRDDRVVRDALRDLNPPDLSCQYYPEVTAERASEILRDCSFAWIDYFGKGKAWPGMIFKSGSFAACCAHGVIPVFSHSETALAVKADPLPGPYFITPSAVNFPELERVAATQQEIYTWYHRHASSRQTARAYAEVLV